jgi:hypothetical protein
MAKNPQKTYNQYSRLFSTPLWKATWTAPIALFLSFRVILQSPFTTNEMIAKIRKAHGSPNRLIMAFVASE